VIRIVVELDNRGLLRSLAADGHAAMLQESGSIPCAAVSALVGTAARLIEARDGIVHSGGASAAGSLNLTIHSAGRRERPWLQGVTDYVVAGLQDVEREYPAECRVEIRTKE
jgi:uncharacterized protein YsxB (DUF464 family)